MKHTRGTAGLGLVSAIIAAVLMAVAAYWYWSPQIVVHQMRQAAEARDADAIDAHVDYPALRESFRAQLSQAMKDKIGDPRDNPFSALGTMIGMAVVGPLIDTLVQPGTIAAAIRNGQLDPARPAASQAQSQSAHEDEVRWTYERKGFDVVIATPHRDGNASDAHATQFVFTRHGFADWKLSEIRFAR